MIQEKRKYVQRIKPEFKSSLVSFIYLPSWVVWSRGPPYKNDRSNIFILSPSISLEATNWGGPSDKTGKNRGKCGTIKKDPECRA
jgi:hypothetical protein